jgi:hypothetical protein
MSASKDKRSSDIGQKPHRRTRKHHAARTHTVGYGKPPSAHQFKPGQSGNSKGRPKGSRSEATILQELLQHKVALNERGKTRKIILLEAILRKVAEDSLRGNTKSISFLLNRYQAAAVGDAGPADISQDDQAVLDAFLREFKPQKDDDEDLS